MRWPGARCESARTSEIAYGVNSGQLDNPFSMHMNPSTQQRILEDIVEVLVRHGIRKLVILNGHGGHAFQNAIRELEIKHPDMLIFIVNWWRIRPVKEYFDDPGDHADEMETSSMLFLHPEYVLPLETAGDAKNRFIIKASGNEGLMPRR